MNEYFDNDESRLFFVTTSSQDNEELFETLEDAEKYIERTEFEDTPEIWICIVRHAFKEDNGGWNYDDVSDTFTYIKQMEIQ